MIAELGLMQVGLLPGRKDGPRLAGVHVHIIAVAADIIRERGPGDVVLTGELMREGLLPEGGWKALADSLPPPESALCARVSALVGRGDAGSQASSVRLAAEELRASAMDARQAAREKGKLYPTLGLMLGMLAVVLAL